MNKQRLMELAGVTEASYLGQSKELYCVVFIDDGSYDVTGPFNSTKEAEAYRKHMIKDYELDEEFYDIQIELIQPPERR